MKNKYRLAFIHQKMLSFVEKDCEILSGAHQVENVELCQQLPSLKLFKAVLGCDLVFCWFGKMHAFWAVLLARLLNKKTIVVVGGDDVANEKSIGYGMYPYWWKRWCPKLTYLMCDCILPFSENAKRELLDNYKVDPNKITMVYLGYDIAGDPLPELPRVKQILTVGGIRKENLKRKGLQIFVETAKILPQYKFILVGRIIDIDISVINDVLPANVELEAHIDNKKLSKIFSQSKIYVQASLHEGFGSAVAEAMLGGCIPVVSRRAALPEVVGDTGIYIEEQTPEAVAEAVKIALALPADYGLKARQRIIDVFPLEKRRAALLQAVEEVMAAK